MKKMFVALCLSLTVSFAYAQDDVTIDSLAKGETTKAMFQMMAGSQQLPSWVTQGGTNSGTKNVVIGGNKFLVLTSCKPHDCSIESVAVLYSPEAKKMAGVLSTQDEVAMNQKLVWLNVDDELSIDGKTVLFAALSGSLDNHPDSFNFK